MVGLGDLELADLLDLGLEHLHVDKLSFLHDAFVVLALANHGVVLCLNGVRPWCFDEDS